VSGIKVAIAPPELGPMQGAFDRFGGDFTNFDTPNGDPLLCQGACAGNALCKAWAYLRPVPPRAAHCWLKSTTPPMTPNKSTTSGAAGGDLYQLHKDGQIWQYTGTACSGAACPGWLLLDRNPQTKSIVTAGRDLYQLHNDGLIYQYTATPCSFEAGDCPGWKLLDRNTQTVAIVAAGANLYQLHNDGLIYQYTGTPCGSSGCPGWNLLDRNPQTVAVVAAGDDLYQLHNDGLIYQYTGTPCGAGGCPGWNLLDRNLQTISIKAAHDRR
jgi:hypothetical protein